MDTGSTSTDNLIERLTSKLLALPQSISQKDTSSSTNNQTPKLPQRKEQCLLVQDDRVCCSGCLCLGIAGGQNRVWIVNPGQANPLYAALNVMRMVLYDEEQLLFMQENSYVEDNEGVQRVQTALFKEVKVMEEIFDQMNDEVDQNTVDKQCAEIERKNLLIANENLIANCLSNQLLYDVEKSRCLDLGTEMSKVQMR
ncbi:hypothetical protein Tco_0753744 [Tanacetum coccineum]